MTPKISDTLRAFLRRQPQAVDRGQKEKGDAHIGEAADHVLKPVLIADGHMNQRYNQAPEAPHGAAVLPVKKVGAIGAIFRAGQQQTQKAQEDARHNQVRHHSVSPL